MYIKKEELEYYKGTIDELRTLAGNCPSKEAFARQIIWYPECQTEGECNEIADKMIQLHNLIEELYVLQYPKGKATTLSTKLNCIYSTPESYLFQGDQFRILNEAGFTLEGLWEEVHSGKTEEI